MHFVYYNYHIINKNCGYKIYSSYCEREDESNNFKKRTLLSSFSAVVYTKKQLSSIRAMSVFSFTI